jgi:hypothetical protein
VIIFILVALWIVPKIVRALRRLIARVRGFFSAESEASASR